MASQIQALFNCLRNSGFRRDALTILFIRTGNMPGARSTSSSLCRKDCVRARMNPNSCPCAKALSDELARAVAIAMNDLQGRIECEPDALAAESVVERGFPETQLQQILMTQEV